MINVNTQIHQNDGDDESKMMFTADLNILPENQSNLYAVGSVTVDHLFVLHDVKVVYLQKEGQEEKQLTVCLPRHYNRKTESWDHVIQLTKEQRKELDTAVISDLKNKIFSNIHSPATYCSIQIHLCEPGLYPTLGYAEISYRDMLCLKKVRIYENAQGQLQVHFPSNRKKDGSYSTLFGMVTSDHQRGLKESVKEKFREVFLTMTGKEYEPGCCKDAASQEEPQQPDSSLPAAHKHRR